LTISKITSARQLANFCFAHMDEYPFHVQAHKDGTVSFFLVPYLDARVPRAFFVSYGGGVRLTSEGHAYMKSEWPSLQGARHVPLEKAKRMLRKMRCKLIT
jgi:hypothetical protein